MTIDSIPAGISASYIFAGPATAQLATAAAQLARRLNCAGEPDTNCRNCRLLAAGNFPDLITLNPGDKASIGIEPTRQLLGQLALRPSPGAITRLVVIEQAGLLTTEAQNALLKTIEEPPPATIIVLLADYTSQLLDTIRSRCQIIQFGPGPSETQPAGIGAAVAGFGSPSAFNRLLAARSFAESKLSAHDLTAALQQAWIAADPAVQQPGRLAARLAALERCREHLRAGVTPRAALEMLALEVN